MGTSTKRKILAELNKNKKEIYSFEDILKISGSKSANAVRVVVSRIVKDKRLIPLKPGLYLYIPEGYEENWTTSNFWIGANLVEPYAISFWSALNHWGLTEQLPNITYIETTKRMRSNQRKVLNNEYRFVRLSKKRLFGITRIWVANHQVNITDPEKTLADCLAFPEHGGGISEAAKGLYNYTKENKLNNLVSYTQKMGQPALKRLGYLLELLGISSNEDLEKIKRLVNNPNPAILEPLLPCINVKWSSEWKLRANVLQKDLLNWKAK